MQHLLLKASTLFQWLSRHFGLGSVVEWVDAGHVLRYADEMPLAERAHGRGTKGYPEITHGIRTVCVGRSAADPVLPVLYGTRSSGRSANPTAPLLIPCPYFPRSASRCKELQARRSECGSAHEITYYVV